MLVVGSGLADLVDYAVVAGGHESTGQHARGSKINTKFGHCKTVEKGHRRPPATSQQTLGMSRALFSKADNDLAEDDISASECGSKFGLQGA